MKKPKAKKKTRKRKIVRKAKLSWAQRQRKLSPNDPALANDD